MGSRSVDLSTPLSSVRFLQGWFKVLDSLYISSGSYHENVISFLQEITKNAKEDMQQIATIAFVLFERYIQISYKNLVLFDIRIDVNMLYAALWLGAQHTIDEQLIMKEAAIIFGISYLIMQNSVNNLLRILNFNTHVPFGTKVNYKIELQSVIKPPRYQKEFDKSLPGFQRRTKQVVDSFPLA